MARSSFSWIISFGLALVVCGFAFASKPWIVFEMEPSYHHTHGCSNAADWLEDMPGPFAWGGGWQVGCVEIPGGRAVPCYTRWNISVSPAGVASLGSLDWWRGGHEHDFDRSSGARVLAIGLLTSDLAPGTPIADQWHFEGDTWYHIWSAKYQAPDAAGVIRLHGEYTCLDPGGTMIPTAFWHADPSNSRRVVAEAIIVVGLHGLEELPSEPYAYLRCGKLATCTDGTDNIDPKHPEAFWGDPEMVAKVGGLAAAFCWLHNYRLELRLTDMSLPWGGLFDVGANWHWPHQRHRNGRSVDVSHYLWDKQKRKLVHITTNAEDRLDAIAAIAGMARYEKHYLDPRRDKIHYELLPATPASLCHPVPWGRGVSGWILN